MIKLKNLLYEGRSQEIKKDELLNYYDSDNFDYFPKATPIYRYINDFDAPYGIVRPKKAVRKRKSRNTENYYTLILDNSDNWGRYPKRSESVVASVNDNVLKEYLVIPKIGAEIGIAPARDIWEAFDGIESLDNDFNKPLIKLSQFAFGGDYILPENNIQKFKREILRLDEKIKKGVGYEKIINNLSDDVKDELKVRDDGQEYLTNKGLKQKSLLDFLKFYVNSSHSNLFDYISYLLDPENNGFELKKYNKNFHVDGRKEVWTDAPCLLINMDNLDILDNLNNREFQ